MIARGAAFVAAGAATILIGKRIAGSSGAGSEANGGAFGGAGVGGQQGADLTRAAPQVTVIIEGIAQDVFVRTLVDDVVKQIGDGAGGGRLALAGA